MRASEIILVAVSLAEHPVALMSIVSAEFLLDAPSVEEAPVLTDEQRRKFTSRAVLVTEEVVEAEITKLRAAGYTETGWRFVDESEVPVDFTFRDAFVDTGTAIAHDMEKAREIQRDRLREARAPLFADLDVRMYIALNAAVLTGDTSAVIAIEAQKQSLRDVTDDPAIDAATTVDELKVAGMSIIESISSTQGG